MADTPDTVARQWFREVWVQGDESAIDRLTSTCHELIVEGDSYRRRQRPAPPVDDPASAAP